MPISCKKYPNTAKACGLITAMLFTTATAQADTITILADEWFPMNGDPASATPGYMIELAKAIFEPAGHTVDYQVKPWERSVKTVRDGEADCVVGAYKEDAPDLVFPTASWGWDQSNFYVKTGESWRFKGFDSLTGQKIGLIGAYAYDEDFDKHIKAHPQLVEYVKANNALEQNIKKIIGGRVTTTVESPLVMKAKLKELKLQGQLEKAGALGEPSQMFIACSPARASSQVYTKLVDEGTAALRASGKLAEILERYGLVDDWQGNPSE